MTADFTPAPIRPPISKAAFDALDIRVGRIEGVDNVEGTDKLVALRVDFGDHKRTIVAGIRLERDASALVGRQSLFVVNMEPRNMRGITSEGMLFDIGYADGILPALAIPERDVPNGARAG